MARKGSNVYKRKDGRWEGRYRYKGTNKYKSVYGKTWTEAKEKLDILRSEEFQPSRTCHFSFEDIMQMWLESKQNRIKESSIASYRAKMDKHIIPYFNAIKYSKFDVSDLEKFMHEKLNSGLSEKYVNDMVIMIKSAAKWAEKTHKYYNKISSVELLKTVKKETSTIPKEQQEQLIDYISESTDITSVGVYLALFTGLRIGELCALKWSDIDFDNKILHINKTVQRINVVGGKSKTEIKISSPKTATSTREIPLPQFIIDKLIPLKRDADCYFLSGTEKVVEPRCFTNRYKKLLEKANLPSYKFHMLRHTFATNCVYQNCDIKTLSELLGHSNANITMRIYIHSSMERKAACMDLLKDIA